MKLPALLFVALVGCTKAPKWTEVETPPPPAPSASTTAAVPADTAEAKPWDLSCKRDDDCVVVRAAGCCPSPCPAGVVNRRDQERAEADLAAACKKAPSRPCPSAGGCRGHSIACVSGQCRVAYEGDPGYRPPSTKAP